MLHFEVEILGQQIIDRQLSRLAERVSDLSPAFQSIYESFLEIEGETFASEGRVSKWAALSEDYAEWRGATGPILQLEGALRRSLAERSGPGHICEIGPQEAKFGTSLETKSGYGLGRTHYTGYTVKYPYGNKGAKPVKVPARKAIELTEGDKSEWVRILQRHIMGSA